MREVTEFDVREEHLELLSEMHVGWNPAEFGAPEIDPKRPYGNSDVIRDIREILDDVEGKQYSDKAIKNLHEGMEAVLSIYLTLGSVEPGTYYYEGYSRNWKKR